MKARHDGDCSIYSALANQTPEAGICTCGYGREKLRQGDSSEMYSEELKRKLEAESHAGDESMTLERFLKSFKVPGMLVVRGR